MSPLVDGWATGEYGNYLLVYRPKRLDPFSKRVKELQQRPCPFLLTPSPDYEGFLPNVSCTYVTYSTTSKNLTTGIAQN